MGRFTFAVCIGLFSCLLVGEWTAVLSALST
jgi:hypothetical protein